MRVSRPVLLVLVCALVALPIAGSAVILQPDDTAAVTDVPVIETPAPEVAPHTVEAAPETAAAGPAAATEAAPVVPAGLAPIGALFSGDGHYCTASVVHSDAGDLVLTAAHCLHEGEGGDYIDDISFAPGYHDGVAPYGMWTAVKTLVAPGWIESSDPDLDVGFITVRQNGNPHPIESVTGANQLGVARGFDNKITMTGYPDDTDAPVVCTNTTSRESEFQMRVDCAGFPEGTSGGPWVTDADPVTKLGTVIGVIGGYQFGGDEADTSYSSYFDTDVQSLYAQSTALG
ncbi:V8-like Glu-specific endopeptidase [Amycolatopsis xylanica]|uniref:V8-like Glu-specific endopeptidase n=1 Tax=Amycolatopsis xylanica TaxID=589385 RepID=A0A1H3SR21_9PSEU|nr:trypsin-like peptidase domain-containing protein [Amycolatopsis xylanica]SDZ40412.1 V8-like Glu-specific endopeptidase [Amycolatopsis xylanica]